MKVLLDAGADPSSTGQLASGKPIATPLFAAVESRNPDAVRLLLECADRSEVIGHCRRNDAVGIGGAIRTGRNCRDTEGSW